MTDATRMRLIRLPYWLGIAADSLWAVALFSPPLFGRLTGRPGFDPDFDVRLILAIGGTLMTSWTCLLVWASRDPIGRRAVILLTAFPTVFGLFLVALAGTLRGGAANAWILGKTALLFVSMIASYVAAGRVERERAADPGSGTRAQGS